jgi:flagellar basal-body rod modification protein FlgD
MKIDGISSLGSEAGSSSTQAMVGQKLSEDDFLKIFIKQMTMQSPDKPIDSGQMMQQMSQLTSLESNKSLKTAIENMNKTIGQSQMINATQMIGKQVVIASTVSPLSTEHGLNGSVVVPPNTMGASVDILDQDKKVVKTIPLAASSSGVVDFHWDGTNAEGKAMNPAFYTMSAKAKVNGVDQDLLTAGYFNVNSVTMDRQTSNVILNVDGMGGVGVGDIIKFLG